MIALEYALLLEWKDFSTFLGYILLLLFHRYTSIMKSLMVPDCRYLLSIVQCYESKYEGKPGRRVIDRGEVAEGVVV